MNFKEFERAAWEAKAARYDASWGSVTIQSIGRVLDVAGLPPADGLRRSDSSSLEPVFLDCGCGPGRLAAAAALRGARVTACDYSAEMVAIAKSNYPGLEVLHEDAEALTFSDDTFDIVVLNFVLLHVPHQEQVVREARRVLKSDGRLVYGTWLPPGRSPGLKVIFDALAAHADMSVIPPAQDIFLFADEERAREILGRIGFGNFQIEYPELIWEAESAEQFFQGVQAGTRMGGLVDLQNSERKERIREAVFAGIEPFRISGGYRIPMPALVVGADAGAA